MGISINCKRRIYLHFCTSVDADLRNTASETCPFQRSWRPSQRLNISTDIQQCCCRWWLVLFCLLLGKESSQLPVLQQQSCLVNYPSFIPNAGSKGSVPIGWGWNTLTVLTNCYFIVSNGCLRLSMTEMSIYLQ